MLAPAAGRCSLLPAHTIAKRNASTPRARYSRRRKQQWEAAHASNQAQLARKAADAEAARAADAAFCTAWGVRLQQLRQEEADEVADARARALEVQRFQSWQAGRREARAAAARRADVQDALMAQAAVGEAHAEFEAYAAALREEAVRRGLPLKPLDKYIAAAAHESPLTASL